MHRPSQAKTEVILVYRASNLIQTNTPEYPHRVRNYSHDPALGRPLPSLGESTRKLTTLAIDAFRLFSTAFDLFETALVTGRVIGRSRRHVQHNLLNSKSAASGNTAVDCRSGSIFDPHAQYFWEVRSPCGRALGRCQLQWSKCVGWRLRSQMACELGSPSHTYQSVAVWKEARSRPNLDPAPFLYRFG